jgi:hypothetical protein
MQIKHIILAYLLLWTVACQRHAQIPSSQRIEIAKENILKTAFEQVQEKAKAEILLLSEKQNLDEKSSSEVQTIISGLQKVAQSAQIRMKQLQALSCLVQLVSHQNAYSVQNLEQILQDENQISFSNVARISKINDLETQLGHCQITKNSPKSDLLSKITQVHDQILSIYLQNPILDDLYQAQKVIEHAEIYLNQCLACEQKVQYQAQICLKDYENALDLLAPVSDLRLRAWLDRCQHLEHPITKALMAYRKTMLSPVKEAEWLSAHDALPEFLAFYVRFKIAQRKIIEVIEATEQIEQFVQDETARKQYIHRIQMLMKSDLPQKEKLANLWDALLIRHDELLIPSLIQSKQQSAKLIRSLARRQAIDYLTNCQKCTHQAKIQEFFEKSAFMISQKWTRSSDQAIDFMLSEDQLWTFYDHQLHQIKLNVLRDQDPVLQGLATKNQDDLFLLTKDVISTFPKDFKAPKMIYSAGVLWMKTDYLIKAFKADGSLLLSRPMIPKTMHAQIDHQSTNQYEECLYFKENIKGMTCIASNGTILMIDQNGKEQIDQSFLGQTLIQLTPEYAVFSAQNQSKIKVFRFENQSQFFFDFKHNLATLKPRIKNHKLFITHPDRLALFDLQTQQIKWQKSILIDDLSVGFQDQYNGQVYVLKSDLLSSFNISDGRKIFDVRLSLDGNSKTSTKKSNTQQSNIAIQILDQINDRLMLKFKNRLYFVDLEGHIRHQIEFKNDSFSYLPFTINQFMIYEKNGLISIYDVKTQALSWQSKILPFDRIEIQKTWFVTQYENRLSLYDFTLGKDDTSESWHLENILKQNIKDEQMWQDQEKQLLAIDDDDACAVSQWQSCFKLIEKENLLTMLQKENLLTALCQFSELKACAQILAKSDSNLYIKQNLNTLYQACLFDQSDVCLTLRDFMLNAENGIKNAQEKATYLLKIASKKGNLKAQFKLAEQLYQLPQAESDQVEAIEIYQDLCDQSQWEACFKLGHIYEQRKSDRSLVLFDLACRGGIKEACR